MPWKLHKSKQINEIIEEELCNYVNFEENIIVEALSIVEDLSIILEFNFFA